MLIKLATLNFPINPIHRGLDEHSPITRLAHELSIDEELSDHPNQCPPRTHSALTLGNCAFIALLGHDVLH